MNFPAASRFSVFLSAVLALSASLALTAVAQSAPPSALLTTPSLTHEDRVLARDIFAELININSTLSVGSTTRAADAMAARLRDAGFPSADVEVIGSNPNRKNLLARWRSPHPTGKPILFICHLDVVEAPRSEWQTDPFVFTEKDGYFYGRGTQDVKDGDAALVYAFTQLRKQGFVPTRDLILALTADEEGGPDNGVDWLLKNRPELKDVAFVINPDAGGVYADHGRATNMEVEATEKLYADFQYSASGPGGHSSLPTPDNVIDSISCALVRLQNSDHCVAICVGAPSGQRVAVSACASPFPVELNPITRAYFKELASVIAAANVERKDPVQQQTSADMAAILNNPPDPAALSRLTRNDRYNALLRTTCTATRFNAGEANNAIPAEATANVNCRILPGHSAEEVRQQLLALASAATASLPGGPTAPANKITISYRSNALKLYPTAPSTMAMSPPPPMPAVFDPLSTVTHQLWPGLPIIPEMETGASDSIYTMAAGLPSYGINGFQIDNDNLRFHARDERLGVEDYYRGVQFFYLYIKALGSK
jgi:acetylornithine deacetylase/succinyl-diaminopimelate desuccinylase-like protein